MKDKGSRSEQEIFADLAALCVRAGYVHALAHLCFRDNIILYAGQMTEADMREMFSPSRLIRTEINTLIGLMVKADIDWALPTPHTDFIFAVITEEMGLLVALLLLGLYVFLFLRAFVIARHIKDPFGQTLGYGISSLLGFHVLFNIGVTTGLLPPTGVSLPFLSYGGSSLLMFSIAMGILLNLSKHVDEEVVSNVEEIHRDFQESLNE